MLCYRETTPLPFVAKRHVIRRHALLLYRFFGDFTDAVAYICYAFWRWRRWQRSALVADAAVHRLPPVDCLYRYIVACYLPFRYCCRWLIPAPWVLFSNRCPGTVYYLHMPVYCSTTILTTIWLDTILPDDDCDVSGIYCFWSACNACLHLLRCWLRHYRCGCYGNLLHYLFAFVVVMTRCVPVLLHCFYAYFLIPVDFTISHYTSTNWYTAVTCCCLCRDLVRLLRGGRYLVCCCWWSDLWCTMTTVGRYLPILLFR